MRYKSSISNYPSYVSTIMLAGLNGGGSITPYTASKNTSQPYPPSPPYPTPPSPPHPYPPQPPLPKRSQSS